MVDDPSLSLADPGQFVCSVGVSVQRTELYAQSYVLAWKTVPMGNKCE